MLSFASLALVALASTALFRPATAKVYREMDHPCGPFSGDQWKDRKCMGYYWRCQPFRGQDPKLQMCQLGTGGSVCGTVNGHKVECSSPGQLCITGRKRTLVAGQGVGVCYKTPQEEEHVAELQEAMDKNIGRPHTPMIKLGDKCDAVGDTNYCHEGAFCSPKGHCKLRLGEGEACDEEVNRRSARPCRRQLKCVGATDGKNGKCAVVVPQHILDHFSGKEVLTP